MIALDTNLLIYAHRSGTPEHKSARSAIERACNDVRGCGITSPSICEFWSVVTHPSAPGRPSTPAEASAFINELVETGGINFWTSGPGFATRLMQMASDLNVTGTRVFDLQIAIIAFENGAHELWTHDAKFVRVPGLLVLDPLA